MTTTRSEGETGIFERGPRDTYSDQELTDILQSTRTIAIVGASPKPDRHSHRVMQFMQTNGYRTIPVNPAAAGSAIFGETVYASLADIPEPFDMVDVFRKKEAIPSVVDEVLAAREAKGIRTLWLQLGLYDEAAARRARDAGLTVIMDRCLKVEFGRLRSHT